MNSIMETVCLVCNTVRRDCTQGTSFQKLLTEIRRQFRKFNFEIKIRTTRNITLGNEEFYVNAYYDADDDYHREIPIEVVIHHNFDVDVVWDKQHVTDLLIQIFDAIVHEFKHQRQSRKRSFEVFFYNGSYLSDPDEIDAYALSIAIELCRNLGKYRALRYMHRFSTLGRLKIQEQYVSPNLHAYTQEFDPADPILQVLAKKVYVRIQKVDTDCIFV